MTKYIPEGLPEELLEQSLFLRSYEELVSLCHHKDSRIYSTCKQPRFWEEKLKYEIKSRPNETLFDIFKDSSVKGRIIYVNLLMNEVDPSSQNNSVIKLAAENNQVSVLKLLLSDERIISSGGLNIAIEASATSRVGLDTFKMFLENEVISDDVKQRILERSIRFKRSITLIKLILSDDNFTFTYQLLLTAIYYGNYDVLKCILEDGKIDPSINHNEPIKKAVQGRILRGRAARLRRDLKIIELLMSDERVDPSDNNNEALFLVVYKDNEGYSSENEDAEIIKLLLTDEKVLRKFEELKETDPVKYNKIKYYVDKKTKYFDSL